MCNHTGCKGHLVLILQLTESNGTIDQISTFLILTKNIFFNIFKKKFQFQKKKSQYLVERRQERTVSDFWGQNRNYTCGECIGLFCAYDKTGTVRYRCETLAH